MLDGTPHQLRSNAGEASWTPITDDGRGGAGEPVDLSQDDKDDDIVVELHTDVGQVAKAVVKIADIWAVGTELPSLHSTLCRLCHGAWRSMVGPSKRS